MDASLWIRVPGAMHSIDATMQAYELMREVREKHPHNARRAQEAAVALRDVFVLLMIDTYHCFDIASTEVAKSFDVRRQSMVELRSQLRLARSSICRLAQCSAAFERAVHQIFRAPLSAQEVVDIFVA